MAPTRRESRKGARQHPPFCGVSSPPRRKEGPIAHNKALKVGNKSIRYFSIMFAKDGAVEMYRLPAGAAWNGEQACALMRFIKKRLRAKLGSGRRSFRGVMDNDPAGFMSNKAIACRESAADGGCTLEDIRIPARSPDVSPCDFMWHPVLRQGVRAWLWRRPPLGRAEPEPSGGRVQLEEPGARGEG